MLTIEHALSRYTDEIHAGNSSITRILKELPEEERKEFMELALIIQSLYEQKSVSKFEGIFEKVNRRKVEIYDSMPCAVDFRGNGDDEAVAQIEKIFCEEFRDGNQ